MSTDERTVQWYNEHAADYTRHVRTPNESIYHSMYEKPAMYSLLPDLHGLTAISLGCGSGEDCNHLKKVGAKTVHGIDISEGLIRIAKESHPSCQFQVMDMEHLDFPDASFDFAYSSLAIHYLETWGKVFEGVYRVLRPGSFFLFSCCHPIYTAMSLVQDDGELKVEELSRTKDIKNDTVQIVGDYVTRRSTNDNGWVTWHKSIGEISKEASDAGFMIAAIHEPQPLPEMAHISPEHYETLLKIPNFVIFKLWKPAGAVPTR